MKKGVIIGVVIAAVVLVAAFYLLNTGGTGKLVLQITDAPPGMEISSVNVVLSNIEVHQAKSFVNASNESSETDGKWFTIVQGPVAFDLTQIKNVKQLLGEKALDPGKYTQIRLNVDSAKAVINGAEQNLEIPSGKIKLVKEFSIIEGENTTLTLDFNAEESINKQGNDVYRMTPVIKILEE